MHGSSVPTHMHVSIPNSLVTSRGIVRRIPEDMTPEEIIQWAKAEQKVVHAKRLNRRQHNEDKTVSYVKSSTVVLTFGDYKLAVFTDSSVELANYTCSIGIYCEDLDISVSRKLTNYTTISSAKTLAIREAVKLSKNKTHKVAVISDSLSALQAITKQGMDKEQDYITLSTREQIVKASQKGDVKLI
nr:unnamed protein product [Callosobruchus analis]